MPYFVMLTTLTDEGRRTVMKNPGRIWEVNKEVEAMGAKILTQYAMLGQYDFITILDAPNAAVVARVSAQLGSRGTLQPLTLAALTMETYVKEMEMAKAITE
ncbi:GYD domain-containing protein [Chloroflexota bacterium]